jgi:hypothetical protein
MAAKVKAGSEILRGYRVWLEQEWLPEVLASSGHAPNRERPKLTQIQGGLS